MASARDATAASELKTREKVERLLRPRSVAVVGASGEPTRIGGIIVRSLIRHGFPGAVYPINPKYETIAGLRCYPHVSAAPTDQPLDTAILFVPAAQVAAVAAECGEAGIGSLVVITSGFAELGADGEKLQSELADVVRTYGMAMSGPNCAGIANFAADYAAYGTTNFIDLEQIVKGPVALLTASGGFGATIFTYCQERALGVSHIIGLGNEAVTNSADFLDVLADDPDVGVILANLESIRDPAGFFRAADRAIDNGKPVVVLYGGRSAAGQHAIATHTAALGGSPAAFAGAFRQHGIIQVTDLDQLVDAALVLVRSPAVVDDRVGIVSLAGGGTGLLSDIAADHGFTIPELEKATIDNLIEILPPIAIAKNPLDPTAGYGRDSARLKAALTRFAADPTIDVVIFFPLASQVSYAEQLARVVIEVKGEIAKPLIVIWTAGQTLADGAWRMLHEAGVALFTNTSAAFRALRLARQHRRFAESRAVGDAGDYGPVRRIPLEPNLARPKMGWIEVLAGFGVRVPASELVTSADAAAAAVTKLGCCALKVASFDISHKTEVGGVRLNVSTTDQARAAYEEILAESRRNMPDAVIDGIEVQQMVAPGLEILLGVTTDEQLGPIITVGLGGVFTELIQDVAQRPVPISRLDAQLMLAELRAKEVLDGFRGASAYDKHNLVETMLGLSAFADAYRNWAPEIDLNPLVLHKDGEGCLAVDLIVRFTAPAVS